MTGTFRDKSARGVATAKPLQDYKTSDPQHSSSDSESPLRIVIPLFKIFILLKMLVRSNLISTFKYRIWCYINFVSTENEKHSKIIEWYTLGAISLSLDVETIEEIL